MNKIKVFDKEQVLALGFAAMMSAALVAVADDDSTHGRRESHHGSGRHSLPNMFRSANSHGVDATFTTEGRIDLRNAFFQNLGTNGRTCASCHVPTEGWTIVPEGVKERFARTRGLDPIFRLNDGANSPNADVSTEGKRRKAYSMLLEKANIRVGIPIPANAEFELANVDDPYGFASARELSLFRRPMPTTNLKFLNTLMWDGRETFADANSTDCLTGTMTCFASMHFDLSDQSNGATTGHAQGHALTNEQREEIVRFETALFTAQIEHKDAGRLTQHDGRGGPEILKDQEYYFGINDTVAGDYHTHAAFNPASMTLYSAWNPAHSGGHHHHHHHAHPARESIARGEVLFNSKPIQIKNVKGLNDDLAKPVIAGTCTTCHNVPNSGNHSVPMPLDIGISDASRRTPDMPLYTLRHKITGEILKSTDPGRALITGKWKDIGRFKGPVLRSVASRPPYFHNGMAKNLEEVIDFYNARFGMGLSMQEKEDLVAFLGSL